MTYVNTSCHCAQMETMNERLKSARINAGFESARSAALRFGWSPSTYAAHENGQNSFGTKSAMKYADAFKSDPSWLLVGDAEGGTAKSYIAERRVRLVPAFVKEHIERMRSRGDPPPSLEKEVSCVTALALLEDLLEAKRIMPTEHRTLQAAIVLALESPPKVRTSSLKHE